jgi:magnesium transporter
MSKEKEVEQYIHLVDLFIEDPSHTNVSSTEVAKALKQIHKVDEVEFAGYLQRIPNEYLGDIALELPEKYLKDVLNELPAQDMVEVIEELDSDDATDLIQDIEDIDQEKAEEILSSLGEENQEEIKMLKRYDENQAGAHMQTELFSANYDETIEESIDRMREYKRENRLIDAHNVFIVGTFGKLMFTIPLQDLITFDFDKSYKEMVMEDEEDYKSQYVRDDQDIDEVAQFFKEHDLSVAPVVNYHGELVGRITSDDIFDVLQESATEQIYNLAGVDDEAEDEENFLETGKKRGSWLFINLLTAILASVVIQYFDETIQAFVALAVLMPIVASMGGNAGTQTLTVTVRRLALGDIELEDAKETLKKEVMLGLVNGFVFALILGAVAYAWFKIPMLGVVIALSMVINLLAAGFFGAAIPLLFKRANIDPAVGSTVILTTVTDVVGFLSFLGLAKWLLM